MMTAAISNLTYTWTTTGTPPAPVVFSVNGTNAAKNTTAIFTKAGAYSFLVTIRDSAGLTVTSSTNVTVSQTLTSVVLSPNPATVIMGGTQQFTAVAKDQFGNSLTSQPSFAWAAAPGTINSAGLYTAPVSGTTATVTASSGGKTGTATVNLTAPASIAERLVFYNNSTFDDAADDGAIAADKQALLPGQTAAFANYTSYDKGINGIIVDIQNLANPIGLTAADFQFKVGNDNNPAGWTTAPAPASITVRQDSGTGGSDRVTIIWTDNTIENQWLQVTIKATANTGLSAADVFYFGNAVSESGDSSANAIVSLQDETAAWSNKSGFYTAPIDSHWDYNRDGRVTVADVLIARHNHTDGTGGNPLQLISAPTSGPLAAQATLQPVALSAGNSPTETVSTQIISAAIASIPTSVSPITSLLHSGVEVQLPDVLRPADHPALFSLSLDTGAPYKQVRTLERGNQDTLSLRGNDAALTRPVVGQDHLHDAFFARFAARRLLAEDGMPDNSPVFREIETQLDGWLAAKPGKQLFNAIDTIFAAARQKK